MDDKKETVEMLDRQGKKVTVRKCRMQICLDLGWTIGWPKDENPESDLLKELKIDGDINAE